MENIPQRINELKETIESKILLIDQKYRFGPSLYFYEKIIECRKKEKNIISFLNNDKNIEYIYSTLVAWDMNSRGAKMKYYTDFKQSIVNNSNVFINIENLSINLLNVNFDKIITLLENVYKKLDIMYTNSRLVSTSKTLHFLFPDLIMPMDRMNTLQYFYNNTGESLKRFLEIFEFSYHFAKENIRWNDIMNNGKWNTSIPKIIDNAIILKMNISTNEL